MRDLELRGAGNLMGSQQHGYMITVWYDMYCKLLSDAIKSLKGEKVDEEFETTVDLSINAYIPDSYIDTEKSKIAAYRSIASISTMSEYIDVAEELKDRYGKLPISVSNLIEVAFLKYIANSIGIVSIVQAGNYINLIFGAQADIQEDKVERVMNNYSSSIRFVVAKTHKLIYRFNSKEERVDFRELRSIIIELR
jgi:transcription-repair coupling factor (superfamily II helicase)